MSKIQKWLQSPNVEKLARKKDFAGLILVLDHPDESIFQQAHHALVASGIEAIESLAGALSGKNNHLRKNVVDILGEIGNPDAVNPLLALLKEKEILEPQLAAIDALGKIGSSRAVKPLINFMIRVIEETTWEHASPKYDHQRSINAVRALVEVKNSLLRIGEVTIPQLSASLDHDNRMVRYHLARAIGLFGMRGIRHLVNLLNDEHSKTRLIAAQALDQMFWVPVSNEEQVAYWIAKQDWDSCARTGKAAVSSLLPFLNDENENIARSAAQTLQKIGWLPGKNTYGAMYWVNLRQWDRCVPIGEAAAPVLVKFIEKTLEAESSRSEKQKEIGEATSALVQIGQPALKDIINALQSDQPKTSRIMAEVLWRMKDPAISPLLDLLQDQKENVREQVIWILGKLGAENYQYALRVITSLNHALNDPASNVSRMAADYVGEIGARYPELTASTIPVLIAMLKDKVNAVSEQAAVSLGMIGDPLAVEPLIEALFSQNAGLRVLSANALGKIRDRRAVEPLIKALEQPVYGIQHAAATALGLLEDKRAVGPLILALKSREPELRKEAADALGKIKDQDAVEGLIALLYDPNPAVKLAAIQALGSLESKEALPQLVDILKATQISIQDAAAEAILSIGGQQAAERLVFFLINSIDLLVWDPFSPEYDPEMLEFGKRTLEKVKTLLVTIGEDSTKPLIATLGYSGARVRQVVSEILQKIGQPAVVELLRTLIHTDRYMRLAAAEELDKMGWKPKKDEIGAAYWIARQEWDQCTALGKIATNPLVTSFRDTDPGIRQKAVECLDSIGWEPSQDAISAEYWIIKQDWEECAKIGDAAVEPLVRYFAGTAEQLTKEPQNPEYKENIEGIGEALVKIGDPAIEPLLTLLQKGAGAASLSIIEILCRIGKNAAPPLISALNNREAAIRFLAARALGRIASNEAIEPLIVALDDPDDRVCREAVISLGSIGDRRAVEPLILRLSDLKEEIRREAAIALGKIRDFRAQQPLMKALQDTNEGVRIAAAQALGKFADEQAVPALVNTLRREREETQRAAAEALVAIGGVQGIEMLIDLLVGVTDSTNWNPASQNYDLQSTLAAGYIQIKTKWALAEMAPQSIQPLILALKGKSEQVRFHIHQTLGMIGEPAIEALIRRLEDPDTIWRMLAADALKDTGWQPGMDRNSAAYWAIRLDWDKCAAVGSEAVPILIRALRENSAWERMKAAEALVKIGWKPEIDQDGAVFWIARQDWRRLAEFGGAASTPLINTLYDFIDQMNDDVINRKEGNNVIERIKDTLVEIGEPAINGLVNALKKSNNETRPHLSAVLARIGAKTIEPLKKLMQEKDPILRMTIAAIWGEIRSEKSVSLLIEATSDSDELVREQVVNGLAKTGAGLRESTLRVELIETLVQALKDPSSRVQKAAQKALLDLDWQGSED